MLPVQEDDFWSEQRRRMNKQEAVSLKDKDKDQQEAVRQSWSLKYKDKDLLTPARSQYVLKLLKLF